MADAPLDMRMDKTQKLTAEIIVNTWPRDELKRIISEYGEERYASSIARAIEKAREGKRIETTHELSEIIKSAMPASARKEKQHPAKRTFQAVRIAVNDELSNIRPGPARCCGEAQ
jgi:16S rRNA (cytosine1402-N4)-methyltransferase